jgi:2-octaprenyl-6-methoxyphenol hydroxylase
MPAHVIVAGAGPAGLAAACLLAVEGVPTTIVAPAAAPDPRTVAAMTPAMRLLRYIGIWPSTLEKQSAALRKLKIVDDTGAPFAPPPVVFDAREIGEEAFGWNIPLAALVDTLRERAVALGAECVDARVMSAVVHPDAIAIRLDNGQDIAGSLCIAADGAGSRMRAAAGIAVDHWSYDQAALASSFAHSCEHDEISTEYYKQAGLLTTVPLPGSRSSLVWMDRPSRIETLVNLSEKELASEIQAENHGDLGLISAIGSRKVIAMQGMTARRFAARRTILIGEAAHVVPPLGAQGLNMSLRDAALAADLILAGQEDPGAEEVLSAYDEKRRSEVTLRQALVDTLDKSLLLGSLPLEAARAASLWTLNRLGPLRREIMHLGLSDEGTLPFAMRM